MGRIMVRVRFYGSFRTIVKKTEAVVKSDCLGTLLDTLKHSYPDLAKLIDSEGFIVLVNEKPIPLFDLNLKLSDEDVVDLLPVISGG